MFAGGTDFMDGFLKRMRRNNRLRRQRLRQMETNTMLLAGLHVDRIRKLGRLENLREAEFKAYSQGGEDGIIQYLIANIAIQNRSFIEFGVLANASRTSRLPPSIFGNSCFQSSSA